MNEYIICNISVYLQVAHLSRNHRKPGKVSIERSLRIGRKFTDKVMEIGDVEELLIISRGFLWNNLTMLE